MDANTFDQAYYDRYYFNPRTRIADPSYFDRLAAFIGAYLHLIDCKVMRILDVGCGAGLIHAGLRRAFPGVHIEGIDVSAWACTQYGWRCVSIEEFESARTFDLVICHDVMQYLDQPSAAAALAKLIALTRRALFFSVLTSEDWDENCDQTLTDGNAHLRSAAWYNRRLSPLLRNAGGGLYIRRDADIVLYALEHC